MRKNQRNLNTVKRAIPQKWIRQEISETTLSKQLVFSISKLKFGGEGWALRKLRHENSAQTAIFKGF